jgi:hypothetical protein
VRCRTDVSKRPRGHICGRNVRERSAKSGKPGVYSRFDNAPSRGVAKSGVRAPQMERNRTGRGFDFFILVCRTFPPWRPDPATHPFALEHLSRHGIAGQPEAVVGDAGYWNTRQIESITARGIEVLVPPDGAARDGKRPGWESERYERMRDKLAGEPGRKLYALRKTTIEPVFGQIKYNRRVDRFMRRGRAAVHSELRLVAATHNMLKLHTHWIANTA